MDELVLWGLPLSVVVLALVEAIKAAVKKPDGSPGIEGRAIVALAIVCGLVCAGLANVGQYAGLDAQGAVAIVGQGLLAGLAACGLYSGAVKQRSP